MNLKNILGFAAGPILISLLGIITLPVTAWLFTAEAIGRVTLFNTFLSLCLVGFSLGMDQSYVRAFHSSKSKLGVFKASALPSFFLVMVYAVLFFVTPTGDLLTLYIFGKESLYLKWTLILSTVAILLNRFILLTYRMEEKGVLFSLLNTTPKIIILILLLSLFFSSGPYDLDTLVFIHSISLILTASFVLFFSKKFLKQVILSNINLEDLRGLLSYGVPLAFASVIYWGVTSFDRFMIEALSSIEELAVYSLAASFAASAVILQRIFSIMWAPIVYKRLEDGKSMDRVTEITGYLQTLIVIIFLVTAIFSPVFALLLPPNYHAVSSLVLGSILVPLLYTLSESTVIGINITKKSYFSFFISSICFATNFLLNVLLIPSHGASGAVVSTVITFLMFFIMRTLISDYLWCRFKRKETFITIFTLCAVAITHIFFYESFKLIVLLYALFLILYVWFKWKTLLTIILAMKNIRKI